MSTDSISSQESTLLISEGSIDAVYGPRAPLTAGNLARKLANNKANGQHSNAVVSMDIMDPYSGLGRTEYLESTMGNPRASCANAQGANKPRKRKNPSSEASDPAELIGLEEAEQPKKRKHEAIGLT